MNRRKLPIGIQSFEKLRTENFVYVDKTRYVYELAMAGAPYFLSRPRRFGKSLLLSTLKAYFLGKKELFEGLEITEMEKDWIEYPVFHLDFNVGMYTDVNSLYQTMNYNLQIIEEKYGKASNDDNPATRFSWLIRQAYNQTGKKVVILIDEYDKPLLTTIDKAIINNEMREALKSFYGVLKTSDDYLRFVFITGVSKFSKVTIFSDLNQYQLQDISMKREFSGICGITQDELEQNFQLEIQALAKDKKLTYEETVAKLKRYYDGYHFAQTSEDIYNPFGLLNTFSSLDFGYYWFATGTPTFLVKMLKALDFDIRKLEDNIQVKASDLFDYRIEYTNPVPVLYQTGYLTIKSYNERTNSYTLGYPNEEVKYGFYEELYPVYAESKKVFSEFYVLYFIDDLLNNKLEDFMMRLQAFFADIPNTLNNKQEKHYQTIFFILFRLMGQFVEVESNSATGRADAIIITDNSVFVFEFKTTDNGTAEDALRQIDAKGYITPYAASGKQLFKIGVEFDFKKRGIIRWIVA
jgi:hypothetical protein